LPLTLAGERQARYTFAKSIARPDMMTNRRSLLAGIGAMAALPSAAFAAGYGDGRYTAAIIIDGLTGVGDPDGKEGDFRLSPRGIAQYRESGVTVLGVTVGEVGNDRSNWDSTITDIGALGKVIAANPDVFTMARSAADIRSTKAAGKVAIIFGTQDTAMVGTDLDRLGIP
jgi:membrane dipeptidase